MDWSLERLSWLESCTPGSFPTSTPSPGTLDQTTPKQVRGRKEFKLNNYLEFLYLIIDIAIFFTSRYYIHILIFMYRYCLFWYYLLFITYSYFLLFYIWMNILDIVFYIDIVFLLFTYSGYRMMSVTHPDLCRRVALRHSIGKAIFFFMFREMSGSTSI